MDADKMVKLWYDGALWVLDNLDKQNTKEFELIDGLYQMWGNISRELEDLKRKHRDTMMDVNQSLDLFDSLGIHNGDDLHITERLIDLLRGDFGYCDPHKTKGKIEWAREKWAKEDEVTNDGRE